MPPIPRRHVLRGAAAAGVALTAAPAGALERLGQGRDTAGARGRLQPLPVDDLRCYVLVVDGLSREEVSSGLMPRLDALRRAGTWCADASAAHIAETLPNHVAMMTGVTGARNGVPANVIFDRELGRTRTLDRPEDLTATTLFEALRAQGRVTAAALSKTYLHGIFDGRPDHHWQPGPLIPVSDHAPDPFTMQAALEQIDAHDPALSFVNLGDVDRSGHSDATGSTLLPAFRTTVLAETDVQIGRFVDHLVATGRWERSVVVVLADHSMDWSLPHKIVGVREAFDADPRTAERYAVAENGGAGCVYYTGEDPALRAATVAALREIALAQPGMAAVADPDELGLGARAGDLVLFVEPGHRFSHPSAHSNPIPGNHGHLPTIPIPFLVAGGAPFVRRGRTVQRAVRSIDVAATVAWLFDASLPGIDGRPLAEAFAARPIPA